MGFRFAPKMEGSGGRGGQTSLVRSGSAICCPGGPGHNPGQPQACLCSSVTRGCGGDSHLAGGSVVITWYTGVLAEHQPFSLGRERAGDRTGRGISSPGTPRTTLPRKSHLSPLSLPWGCAGLPPRTCLPSQPQASTLWPQLLGGWLGSPHLSPTPGTEPRTGPKWPGVPSEGSD